MDNKIREGIEVCRLAGDDLLSSDMTDVARHIENDTEGLLVYRRVQAWDAVIHQSLDQVIVPAGLADRILERLRSQAADAAQKSDGLLASSVASAVQFASPSDGATASEILPASADHPHQRGWTRRRWMSAGVATLLAAVMVVAAANWLRQPSNVELDVLARRARS